jgi:hypothetical protein
MGNGIVILVFHSPLTPNAQRPTPNAQRPTPNAQRPTPNAQPFTVSRSLSGKTAGSSHTTQTPLYRRR